MAEGKRKIASRQVRLIVLIVCVLVPLISVIAAVLSMTPKLSTPAGLARNGDLLVWDSVENADYYVININGESFTAYENSYDITALFPKSYNAKVQAVNAVNRRKNSEFSNTVPFTVARQNLSVIPNRSITIAKEFDGTNEYSDEIILGEHYTLGDNLRFGQEVDLNITSVRFNSANVPDANALIVSYTLTLQGEDATNYQISGGSFNLTARITPKKLIITPNLLAKQYASLDNLTDEVFDEELNRAVSIVFMRTGGESIGFYDLTGAADTDRNYLIEFAESAGLNRFEITRRYIEVASMPGFIAAKMFDGGTAFTVADFRKDTEYVIHNSIIGYEVDITLMSAEFNSADVVSANTVTAYFSFDLTDPHGVYKIVRSDFEIAAEISPKQIHLNPHFFTKEFGDSEVLGQSYFDADLNQTAETIFTRAQGESIGFYDLTAAQSLNPNYAFEIIQNTGINKFSITKRLITVSPLDAAIEKSFDGNTAVTAVLEKDLHYTLNRELSGYPVDIIILSALYNNPNTALANEVTVHFGAALTDPFEVYQIEGGSFASVHAHIHKKQLTVVPDGFTKQYGSLDDLTDTFFDAETDTLIGLTYTRTAGETVGLYNLISAVSHNDNFEFNLSNAANKFTIQRRTLTVTAENIPLTKVFDNTDTVTESIFQNTHYTLHNTVLLEETDIAFTLRFNRSDSSANGVIVTIAGLTHYTDRYELLTHEIILPATITQKPVTIMPNAFSKQYLDGADFMSQSFTDADLGLTFTVHFTRTTGETAGTYDITGALSDNANYLFTVQNGADKFTITPRLLGVEIIGNPVFSKVYDGTRNNTIPITLNFHYTLTNLSGGTGVTLNILSQEFDSADVLSASKLFVRYDALIEGGDGNFVTSAGTMEFDAVITPRHLSITPDVFTKRYSETIELQQSIFDPVTGESIPVSFLSTAGLDHTLTDAGTYDIEEVFWTDTNYAFTIVLAAGTGRFIIQKNEVMLAADNRSTVFNAEGQGIAAPSSTPDKPLTIEYGLSGSSSFSLDLPVNAGTYTVRIIFDGDNNYHAAYIERVLFIERATAVITDTTPNNYVYDGTVKPVTATLNHNEAPLSFSRNDYINAGAYSSILISVPQTQNYRAASIVVSLTIAQKVLTDADIAFPSAADITFGQFLYSSVLSNGSPLGSFSWADGLTQPLVSDTQFTVHLTPLDLFNYDWSAVTLSRPVNLTVHKLVVSSITFPTAQPVLFGQPLSASALTGTTPFGTFAWETPQILLTASGNHYVIFTPHDTDNYDWQVEFRQEVAVIVWFKTAFESFGGSPVSEIIAPVITDAPFTYKAGYAFDAWYFDAALTQPVVFPYHVTSERTLYAAWRSAGLSFRYIQSDNTYAVSVDHSNPVQEIFIPAFHRGAPVTCIDNDGFRDCTWITVVVIPESVTVIGHNAFLGCTNLRSIIVCNLIGNISFGAFWSETGFSAGTDFYFGATPCDKCDGATDFHQFHCEDF